jgi:hypothetical protein
VDDHAPSQLSVAETLPDTYRLVLDRIADLETAGFRREADLVRSDAITAYSRRWNEGTARRLERLAIRADRVLDGRDRPRLRTRGAGPEVIRWLSFVPIRAQRRFLQTSPGKASHGGGGMTAERPTL